MAALLFVTTTSTACGSSERTQPESKAALQSEENTEPQGRKDEADLWSQEANLQSQEADDTDLWNQVSDSMNSAWTAMDIGYEDEKKSIDLMIEAYWASYVPHSEYQVDLSSVLGVTENLYDSLNRLDPNLKNVAALSAAVEHDGTIMEKYLVGKGVGAFLADNETGQMLRSGAEFIAVGLLQGMINGLLAEDARSRTYARYDSLMPLVVGENYTLVRSLGNISDLLVQIEKNSGYTYRTQPLIARKEALETARANGADLGNCTGRISALDEAIEEATAELIPLKKELLRNLGFSEEDINARFATTEDEETEEFDLRGMWRDYMNFTEDELAAYEAEAAEALGVDTSSLLSSYQGENYIEVFDAMISLHPEFEAYLEGFDAYLTELLEPQESPSPQEQEVDLHKPLMSSFIYCVIDRSGKVYGSFLSPYRDVSATLNEDGTFTLTQYAGTTNGITYDDSQENAFYHVIVSREGRILYASDTQNSVKEERIVYYDLSPNGNTLRKTYSSDFENGDLETLEFIRADGTAEVILSGKTVSLWHPDDRTYTRRNDYYEYSCAAAVAGSESASGIIDMYTGQLITGDEFYARTAESADTAPQPATGYALNDRYAISGSTIYDYEGTAVKELTAGNGVESIRYSDGKYMVLTVSGWYYVLDEQLEYASEPLEVIKKNDDGTAPNVHYQLTPYGLFMEIYEGTNFSDPSSPDYYNYADADLNYYLYDRDGQKVLLHTARNRGWSQTYDSLSWNESYSYIMGNEYAGWLNMDTMEPMLLDMDGVIKTLAAQ